MLQYGMNITGSDMKNMLERNDKQQSGVRTWRQLFGNASLSREAQSDAVKTDFDEAITDAYRANLERQNSIAGAGLNVGATKRLYSDNNRAFLDAYDTHNARYNKARATIDELYNKEVQGIDSALTERAGNFSKLYNSAYKYLTDELAGAYMTNGEGENMTQTDYLKSMGLDWMRQGDSIMPWDQLSKTLFDAGGNLTDYGTSFFDHMFNAQPQSFVRDLEDKTVAARTFDQWLSDTDLELRDWYAGQDVFNYNAAGSNRGTSNTIAGNESTDSTPDIDSAITEYKDNLDISDSLKDFNKDFSRSINNIRLGIQGLPSTNTSAVNRPANGATPSTIRRDAIKIADNIKTTISNTENAYKAGMTTIEKALGDKLDDFKSKNKQAFDELDSLYKSITADVDYKKDLSGNVRDKNFGAALNGLYGNLKKFSDALTGMEKLMNDYLREERISKKKS